MSRRSADRERGAGTVLVLMVIALVVVLGSAVVMMLLVVSRQERVQAVADVAAEGVVSAALDGAPDPCGVAARWVSGQGLRLQACAITGMVAEVVIEDPDAGVWRARTALSRAGAVGASSA